jgi:hypothetical protein
MPTPSVLDLRIRSLVTELIESAPEAPTIQELEWRKSQVPRGRRPQRTRGFVLVGAVMAVVAAVLIVALLPVVGHRPTSEAAAAQLHRLADNAANQPALQLANDQWLHSKQEVSFFAQVSQVGSTPTPDAQATVRAAIQEWANGVGESCTSATASPAQFASSANEAAWHAAGLLDIPNEQPVTGCTTVGGATGTNGLGLAEGTGVTDVSGLPTDPTALAHKLETGTTGIAGLDQISSSNQSAGFERAAALLIGPTTGASPTFNAALLNALAMLPGIARLGETNTHSGTSGLGFAANSVLGRSVIVLDSATGALLEAQNVEDQGPFTSLESSYLAPTPGIGTEGGTFRVIIQWLDPIGSPSVVGRDSFPPGLNPSPSPVRVAGTIIAADANVGVTYEQLETLETQLKLLYGQPASQAYSHSQLNPEDHPTALTLLLTGPESQVSNYVAALKASGLFFSVVVRQGDSSP